MSIASLWEIAIKFSIGKLILDQPFAEIFPRQLLDNDIKVLDITVDHRKAVSSLSFYHRDPFDRLIIAPSQSERLPIISTDTIFDSYPIKREW